MKRSATTGGQTTRCASSASSPATLERRDAIVHPSSFSVKRWRGQLYYNLNTSVFYKFKHRCSIVLGRTQQHLSLRHIAPVDLALLNKRVEEQVQNVERVTGVAALRMPVKGSVYVKMADRFIWRQAPSGEPSLIPFGVVWGIPTVEVRGTCFGNNLYKAVFLVHEVEQVFPGGDADDNNNNKENIPPPPQQASCSSDPVVQEWAPRDDDWMRTEDAEERERAETYC